MSSTTIKSGKEIVSDFLQSLENESDIDAATLQSVQELFSSESLTSPKLLQRLASIRAAYQEQIDSGKFEDSDAS